MVTATPEPALAHYKTQQKIAAVTASTAGRIWRQVDDDFDAGWRRIESVLLDLLIAAQTAAARTGLDYVPDLLYDTQQVDLPAGDIIPASVAGTAADGRPLATLLYGAVTTAKAAVADGVSTSEALARGGRQLTMTVLTTVADANREGISAAIGARPHIGGYVRMLNPPSCKRCIILAGKWFRWNEGFLRHPRCDCRHIPASENIAGDFTTDPYQAFQTLTPEQQEKEFGKIEARAIRDGADIYRVVNLQARGLGTARAGRLYGTPTRLTIDDIYRTAGTRTNAIRLMTESGYITGPQVPGGNVIGFREGFGQFGRGGTRVAASTAVVDARVSGIRDRLNRYTMTAAERRVYDAHSMRKTVLEGRNPFSTSGRPLTEADFALAERMYRKQLADLGNQPQQVRDLARLLGMI